MSERQGTAVATGKRIRASSVARALAIIGDRWTLLILGHAFLGARRFVEWRGRAGIASNVLSDRLKRLVKAGCLEDKSSATESGYRLTPMGRDLYPTALMEWRFERRWSSRPRLPSLTHTGCGARMLPSLVCLHCRDEIKPHDVSYRGGPGAGFDPVAKLRLARRSGAVSSTAKSVGLLFGESLQVLGDRWARLVIASPFLGLRRYDEIQKEWNIATNILTDRLKRLLDHGMLQRRLYRSGPDRYEYVLTPKGLDLYPLVLTMLQWGDRWLAGKAGAPLLLRHIRCGRRLAPAVVCDRCGEALTLETVKFDSAGASRGARKLTPRGRSSPDEREG